MTNVHPSSLMTNVHPSSLMTNVHPSSLMFIITYVHHHLCSSSLMFIIIYVHHLCSSLMFITYVHHLCSFTTVYDRWLFIFVFHLSQLCWKSRSGSLSTIDYLSLFMNDKYSSMYLSSIANVSLKSNSDNVRGSDE